MDKTLRLYANPLKVILYLVGSLGFVLVAQVLLQSHRGNTAIIYFALFFFGLCAVVFLIVLLREVVLRHPVLTVDAQGWSYSPSLGFGSRRLSWQDIASVAVYQQQVQMNRMYYLVLGAKYPDRLPHSRGRALTASFYPSLSRAAMSIPLDSVFIRTTPSKGEQLLRDIGARFSHEMQLYGIEVAHTIQEM